MIFPSSILFLGGSFSVLKPPRRGVKAAFRQMLFPCVFLDSLHLEVAFLFFLLSL